MKSLRHILKRLRCMKSNRCEKLHGNWWNNRPIAIRVKWRRVATKLLCLGCEYILQAASNQRKNCLPSYANRI